MKFSKWLRILAVSGCIAATAVSAGAFSCSDFERSGGGPYKETLDALYENMTAGEGSNDQLAGSVGIMETVNALGREAALQGTGFSIEDITGDGVPELLVGSMPDPESLYMPCIRYGTARRQPFLTGGQETGIMRSAADGFITTAPAARRTAHSGFVIFLMTAAG